MICPGLVLSDTTYPCPELDGQKIDAEKMVSAGWSFIIDPHHTDRILSFKLGDPGYLHDGDYYRFNITICGNENSVCTCHQNDGDYEYHEIMFVSIYSTHHQGYISCDNVPVNVIIMVMGEVSGSGPNPYNPPEPPKPLPFIYREVYGIPMFVILSVGIFSTFISCGLIRTAKPIEYTEEPQKRRKKKQEYPPL